jgi:hypothetical protein
MSAKNHTTKKKTFESAIDGIRCASRRIYAALGSCCLTDDALSAYGLQTNDVVYFTCDGDLRQDELGIVVARSKGTKTILIFACFLIIEGKRYCVRINHTECLELHYQADELRVAGRVVLAERDGQPIRFNQPEGAAQPAATLTQPVAKPRTDRARTQRIEHLRQQLRRLKDEGECHNESGVYRLEREIYDLEHETDADVWPDVIGDR